MLDSRSFRPHQVLGDAQQFQAVLEQQRQLAAQTAALTAPAAIPKPDRTSLSGTDPASVPKEIWAAAQLLGDTKGVRLLRVYEELADQR